MKGKDSVGNCVQRFVLLVVLLVSAAACAANGSGARSEGFETPGLTAEFIPASTVYVSFYTANTKEDWINAVTATFNQAGHTTASGKPIVVAVRHGNSGGSQQDILDGAVRPTMWSPGDQSWIDGANAIWQESNDRPLVPDACPQSVLAPIGIGMWRPMAEALGWPDEPISWEMIVALAADPEGWAATGHPEWGSFKFGHTHPEFSNSGLLTLTALAYDAVGQTEGLTADMVHSEPVVVAMRRLEDITYHYGRQSRTLAEKMIERGPAYLHAVNITEAEVLRLNREHAETTDFPLAFIFPAGGTFWTEQPLCILDGDWVTDEQKEAAAVYRDYLLQPEQQERAVTYGLRPSIAGIPLQEPFAPENGTDPEVTPEIVPALPSPSAEAAEAIQAVFHEVKKKATIAIVVDTSSSMSGNKMTSAKAGTIDFVENLNPDDHITVYRFDDQVWQIEPLARVADVAGQVTQDLRGFRSWGNTALYDAVCEAVGYIDVQRVADEASGQRRLYGVVVLSDGQDTASVLSEGRVFACLPTGENVDGIKVFTIAYGDDADKDVLGRIANQTNGRMFEGDPETLEDVYLAISAEQ